ARSAAPGRGKRPSGTSAARPSRPRRPPAQRGVTVVTTMTPSVVIFAMIVSTVVRVVVRAQVHALSVDASLLRAYGGTSTALQSQPSHTG
ncbi:hypothetical protein, partial [Streptomyces sp. LS1784]|uniref:hypothetical protein n=1 Tax=Streptomyces sp. LS1784 TaxID=2851533 RepID=UPI001CCA861E